MLNLGATSAAWPVLKTAGPGAMQFAPKGEGYATFYNGETKKTEISCLNHQNRPKIGEGGYAI